jgi:hypothetical protein
MHACKAARLESSGSATYRGLDEYRHVWPVHPIKGKIVILLRRDLAGESV